MKLKLLSLNLILLFASCSNCRMDVKEIPLTFETLRVDSLLIGKSYGMLLKGSDLLIADNKADSLFHWVDLDNLTSKEVGQIGQGPKEYLSFGNFYSTDWRCGFYDSRLRCSSVIEFSRQNVILRKEVSYSSLDYRNYRVAPTAFNTYIGIEPYKRGGFSIVDSVGTLIKVVGEQPYRDETERKIPELARAMAYQGYIVTSPAGDRLVHAIYTSPMIYFYKVSLTDVTLVNSVIESYPEYRPELGDNSYASAMNRKNILGYMALAVTDKYVYALFSGQSTEEAGLSAFCGSVIRVYDWEGVLQKVYTSNTDMTTFCVSPDDRTIYAVGLVEDYELLKAELE